jgi:hypothetical protein
MTLFGEAAAAMYGLATKLLGWRPDDFWSSTPMELGLALGSSEPVGPDAGTIEALRERFPDATQVRSLTGK